MKILMVNKFLYPKGGSETYVIKLGSILQSNGHEVQYFGLDDPRNILGNRLGLFVSGVDFSQGIRRNLTAPFRIIYSAEARNKIGRVLRDFEPDVIHLNNIQYHLTPSIILEIHRYRKQTGRKVKIVYTAHDYQLVCPSHGLFDKDLRPCEKCLDGNYLHCLKNKCIKNSYAKSLLGMLDAFVWMWNKTYAYIDTIICCSFFLKNKLDLQERYMHKTIALHNFVDPVDEINVQKENYVLQFGHLSKEKGAFTLLEVARRMPDVRFVFAGHGAAVDEIMKVPNAEYVGFKTGKELEMLIRKAKVSVCPSEWFENCPFSVIESQIYGTPVIGSNIGGIPELIKVGYTGELFEVGNIDSLEEKLNKLLSNEGLLSQYSANCRNYVCETEESYYQKLMCIYEE